MKSDKTIHQIIQDYQAQNIDMPIDEVANFINKNANRKSKKTKVILGLLVFFLGAGILLIKVVNHKKQIALDIKPNKESRSLLKNKTEIISLPKKTENNEKTVHSKSIKRPIIKESIQHDNSMDDLMNLSSIDVSMYNNIDKIEGIEMDVSVYNNVNMIITN